MILLQCHDHLLIVWLQQFCDNGLKITKRHVGFFTQFFCWLSSGTMSFIHHCYKYMILLKECIFTPHHTYFLSCWWHHPSWEQWIGGTQNLYFALHHTAFKNKNPQLVHWHICCYIHCSLLGCDPQICYFEAQHNTMCLKWQPKKGVFQHPITCL